MPILNVASPERSFQEGSAMVRFGVIGAGRIGKVHVATLAQLQAKSNRVSVTHVADADAKAASDLAKTVGATVSSPDAIIAAKDVDAVLICSPTDTHAAYIMAAAKAGKAILCEKPVSLDAALTAECLKVVEATKVPLMIGFNRRHDPNFAALERRLRAGDAGAIEIVTVISRDPSPPPVSYIERSGGLFRDMMIHDFDMARFLMAEEFVTVHALGASLVDPAIGKAGDVDTAVVHLQTASGRIAVITNSRRATYGYDQRIEVHGSKGMLSASNVLETTVQMAGAGGITGAVVQNFFLERYAQAYANEVVAFLDAMDKGTTQNANGHDGLMAQRLADAATASAQTGKVVML
jgi:myo-inositol 2-dehydrogenase / D-chiro-inositol 1-dehydrogenase